MLINLDKLAQKQIVVSTLLLAERLTGLENQQLATELAEEFAKGLSKSEFDDCATAADHAFHFVLRV